MCLSCAVFKESLLSVYFPEAAGVVDSSTAVCHRFRHSFVSNLLRGGAPVKAVQQLAGHASAKMTLDTYSHVLEQDLGGVVDLLK